MDNNNNKNMNMNDSDSDSDNDYVKDCDNVKDYEKIDWMVPRIKEYVTKLGDFKHKVFHMRGGQCFKEEIRQVNISPDDIGQCESCYGLLISLDNLEYIEDYLEDKYDFVYDDKCQCGLHCEDCLKIESDCKCSWNT
jgi:hypothetical protein